MKSSIMMIVLVLALTATIAQAADPSSGWLSYAVFTAEPTDIITSLSATMVVPELPVEGGGEPAFWFGVQTANGDGALIQPIMAKWTFGRFVMFEEIFDWTDEKDSQSQHLEVVPGELIKARVVYKSEDRSYDMNMTSSSGKISNYNYKLLSKQTETESVGYFVLEHQPQKCGQLPANGIVSWRDIRVEVNGQVVQDAQWVAMQEKPKCDSVATVLNSTAIDITWDVNA